MQIVFCVAFSSNSSHYSGLSVRPMRGRVAGNPPTFFFSFFRSLSSLNFNKSTSDATEDVLFPIDLRDSDTKLIVDCGNGVNARMGRRHYPPNSGPGPAIARVVFGR